MRLLHRSSVAGVGGGARALRRVDSSPRSPLAPRPPLSTSDSFKKRNKKGSRRARLGARLSAVLHELRLAPRAREKSYRPVHLTEGGSGGGGNGTATEAVAITSVKRGPGASLLGGRGTSAAVADGPFGRTNGGIAIGGGPHCASRSWALAALLMLVLACVVALGKAPAICCCTCGAWWWGGSRAEEQRSGGSAGVPAPDRQQPSQ